MKGLSMETFVVPEGMAGAAFVIAAVIALLREFKWVADRSRFLPYLSMGLGIAAAYLVHRLQPASDQPAAELLNGILQMGVMIGLLASGGYDAIKGPLEKIRGQITQTPTPMILLLLLPVTLLGCNTRDKMLKPAMQEAWQVVRADCDPNYLDDGDQAFSACQCPDLPLQWQLVRPHIRLPEEPGLRASRQENMRRLDRSTDLYCGGRP
jgi:hypothetical protein